jgi:hypothetical protein
MSAHPLRINPSFLREGWKAYETLGGLPKALPYHSLFAQVCCVGKAAFESVQVSLVSQLFSHLGE